MTATRIRRVPSVWDRPDLQFSAALETDWYRQVAQAYGLFYFTSVDFFRSCGCVPALVPITTGSISSPMGLGSDSEPVEIMLHGRRTYLADSMQFALEYYLRQNHPGAFYIMPSFRGEASDARHLNQFYHSEAEIVGGLDEVMSFVEAYLLALCRAMLDGVEGVSRKRLETYLTQGAPICMEVEDAVARLGNEAPFVQEATNGEPLISAAGEQELLRRSGREAIWLMHPSRTTTPFYQAACPDLPDRAQAADLLLGIGETVGCGERHATEQAVRATLELQRVSAEPYDWYLRLKREHPLRTAGFGLGVERFLLWALEHDDIRDVHPVPRLKEGPWPL
ncbi:amino acid--tRNA ligase-related protein [Nitrospirillum viridazoti]|uniref:Asparaginase n=1 Tax=Nitrospirillum viridazoti CBAmc TaxID=1441467 RepID=A0A248JZ69_9PROT|nr:amino acid--tRNA ligase-related protein [Nitrospirillum amazonense]ASG24017.1 asparaginase [Nitrospirillum amazonense CBAmc]TWB44536.1 asparaginyl-tRNA synthetase [Nitrospirillum amazonense]